MYRQPRRLAFGTPPGLRLHRSPSTWLPLAPRGAIAQLEERLDRTQEVAGSSPASSIFRSDVAGWASGAALQELFGIPHQLLNDDRLGRCLDALCPHAEELRGALMLRAIERFGLDAARLHLDLTALRVAGAYEHSALVEKGWSAERRVARQVRALQATSREGCRSTCARGRARPPSFR
jgi:hypothetical protein